MYCVITIALFILGTFLGFLFGWGAGKERTKSLLDYITNKLEQLRIDSKVKVMRRDIAKHYGDTTRADELTTELSGESMIFNEVRNSIREWCYDNNQKEPSGL